MTAPQLPRLLYIGDVPVESTYHGSALLYRLLEGYPSDRLRIVEGNLSRSHPDRRLPGVPVRTLNVGRTRLLNTRLHGLYSLYISLGSVPRARRIPGLLDGFQPDAVLTVGHGHSWVTAAEFARRRRLPLHFIVHDDWPSAARSSQPFGGRIDRQFGETYRAASSRLCVSPFMLERYRACYGVDGRLLYPSRASTAPVFEAPPSRIRDTSGGLVFAFTGTLNTQGHCRLIRSLADSIRGSGGKVVIFGPIAPEHAANAGLAAPNIELRGLVSSDELMTQLRDEADVLFVPMSFAPVDRVNTEVSFPSKLTDCTAVGLPLLICGPEYSSAVRWARENPGVAEIVSSEEPRDLLDAAQRLAESADHRVALASRALIVGDRYFSHRAAQTVFHEALAS